MLDLSRDEVREYLREAVGAVLRAYRIAYVKWDMNRHITDAYSAALPPAQQAGTGRTATCSTSIACLRSWKRSFPT